MKESEYVNIFQNEDTHCWYQGTISLIVASVRKKFLVNNVKICDAGCGTGGLLQRFVKEGFLGSCGFDSSLAAARQLKKRKDVRKRIWQGNVEQLALHNSSHDVITCIDVLYHSNVHNEAAVLKEFSRVLKPNGVCILQLPAFESLRGSHDIVTMTRKRYCIRELKKYVTEAGFKIELCNYRNIWLFPIMLAWRLFSRFRVKSEEDDNYSDLVQLPKAINVFLHTIIKIENYLLPKVHFPFGTSIFCIARKEYL